MKWEVIGLAYSTFTGSNQLIGWSGNNSWGYVGHDGGIYLNSKNPNQTVKQFWSGDKLRVDVNRREKWFSFYLNDNF